MSRIPDFMESLEKMRKVHESKNEDYATDDNPFSNFDVSEFCLSLFQTDRDKTFAGILGIKLGRLSTLLGHGKTPNNESIEDTFIDIANYILLWKADYVHRSKHQAEISSIEYKYNVECAYCHQESIQEFPWKWKIARDKFNTVFCSEGCYLKYQEINEEREHIKETLDKELEERRKSFVKGNITSSVILAPSYTIGPFSAGYGTERKEYEVIADCPDCGWARHGRTLVICPKDKIGIGEEIVE